MAEILSIERREEQKRRWLEELDQQREETTERRRREKLLQSQVQQRQEMIHVDVLLCFMLIICFFNVSLQTEDHELWATHFDSLQRRPPVRTTAPSAPPPAPSNGSERGEWEPSSSLSLVWEAMSSCGADSVGGGSIDTTSGYPARARYGGSMNV